MDIRFEGKTVVVTGAAQGIGRSILTSFADSGANCMLGDIDEEWGEEVAAGLRERGVNAQFSPVDVTNAAQVDALFEAAVEHFGGVDIVVNCPDIRVKDNVVDMKEEYWDMKIAVQLKGTFLVCRAGARQLVKQGRGGRIVTISSTGGVISRVGASAHAASKAGVNKFTEVLALELGEHGITVNAVAPGAIEMVGPSRKPPLGDEYIAAALKEIPIGRRGQPEEIAYAVMFFASEFSQFVTGQLLCVDGGFSAGKLGVRGNSPTWLGPKRGIG